METDRLDNPVNFYQNPKIDILFGFWGGDPIPTKQDKFKPIALVGIDSNGNEKILENFYVKKPESESTKKFHELISNTAKSYFEKSGPIKKPDQVEVFLGITITEKRYRQVDVDNLAKAVLDSLNGIAYEDDSQVSNLLVSKSIHPMKNNGIFIGITKLSETRKGLMGDISLFSGTHY